MSRRDELLQKATNHVLANGLIGLSLRPLAAAIGTSDRMLIYHFGSRDSLITAIIGEANDRSVTALGALPAQPTVRDAVLTLWEAYRREPIRSCEQVYIQAAASGMLGDEPFRTDVRRANDRWSAGLSTWLSECGAGPDQLDRVTNLIGSALLGFYVDLTFDTPQELAPAIHDLADAADALARSARR
ncbi:MAG: TetR/AcrR family transcriptional regulator [Nocardioides sp.]